MDKKQFLKYLGVENANITSLVQSGRRKLHIIFEDSTERIDEFDQNTHELLIRKIKTKSTIKDPKWTFEIGEEQQVQSNNDQILQKTEKNPIFIRKDTLNEFQFRIRNLNYDESVFIVLVENNAIVIKTTIKKYYKKIELVELNRMQIGLESKNLKWIFKNSTLLVTYQKPQKYLEVQEIMMMEFTRLNAKKPKDGDIECNIQ